MSAWIIITVNAAAFLLFGIDKYKAKHHLWRIPERVLLGAAVLGGAPGAIAGMTVFHHKTKHKKFRYGLPAILAAQLLLIAWVRVGK